MDEAMAQAKATAAAARDVPEGCELVAVEDKSWRLVSGKRCRYGAGGPGRKACGRPSVAEMNRDWSGSRAHGIWWAYCDAEGHLFGRWIEDGKIMCWILREISDEAGSTQ